MDDLIKMSDAIEAIHGYWKGELSKMPTTDSEYGEVIDGDCNTLLKHNKELSTRIKDIPSADRPQDDEFKNFDRGDLIALIEAQEERIGELLADRPQGEWIPKHNGYWTCSECGLSFLFYAKGNFCPNCGARMKGADDE